MAFVNSILTDASNDLQTRQDALDRVYTDPGIPQRSRGPTPFWLKDPHPNISNCASQELPGQAQVVIIGSGITGVSFAKTLLEHSPRKRGIPQDSSPPKVVMLEARDICSGATGRNGGHILETAEEYASLKESFGMEQAMKILRFRLSHLETILEIVENYRIVSRCQARQVRFLSAYFDQESWKLAKLSINEFKIDMPRESREWEIVEGSRLQKDFHLPRAVGVISGPAGAIWPYKFVTSVLERLLEKHSKDLVVESNTPVLSITKGISGYQIATPRGTIKCAHVVHCTNAHVTHLVPGLRGHIFPIRGQMSAQRPGNNFSHQGNQFSWIFNYKEGFDYMTQLPVDGETSDGEIMIGGGYVQTQGHGIVEMGIAKDNELNSDADSHLSSVLGMVFGPEGWGASSERRVESMWTGNMGFSSDLLPWIGKLPESLTRRRQMEKVTNDSTSVGSEWVGAAFSGEGMVNCWLSGHALALMLLTEDGEVDSQQMREMESWLPEEMLVSDRRLKRSLIPRRVPEHEQQARL